MIKKGHPGLANSISKLWSELLDADHSDMTVDKLVAITAVIILKAIPMHFIGSAANVYVLFPEGARVDEDMVVINEPLLGDPPFLVKKSTYCGSISDVEDSVCAGLALRVNRDFRRAWGACTIHEERLKVHQSCFSRGGFMGGAEVRRKRAGAVLDISSCTCTNDNRS